MAVENISASPTTFEKDEDFESMDIIHASIIIAIAVIVNITNFLTLLVVHSYKYVFNPNILIGGIALLLAWCPKFRESLAGEVLEPKLIPGRTHGRRGLLLLVPVCQGTTAEVAFQGAIGGTNSTSHEESPRETVHKDLEDNCSVSRDLLLTMANFTDSQVSVFYELLTGSYLPIFDYVIIRVILTSSILNPIVYVTFSKTYRYGYQRLLVKALRLCGYEWRSRKPLGLTGSEMQKISHRMALEEWESPGLVRRRYSKRRSKRKITRMHHLYTVSEKTGNGYGDGKCDDDRAGRQRRYRKNTSIDASRGAGVTSASVKVARHRRNTGQEKRVHAKSPLKNGDTTFVQQQVDFPASSQVLSKDDNGSTVLCQNLRVIGSFRQTVRKDSKSAPCEVFPLECSENASTGNDEIHLQSKNPLPEPKRYLPQTLQALAASAVELEKYQRKGQITVSEASPPARERDGSVSIHGLNGTSVLKPFENSAGTNAQGHVCIHLDVIEFVNRHEMKHKNGSLVSTIRRCQLKDKSQKTTDDEQTGPSFVFSLRENRFLPERIHQESIDTFSFENGEDTSSHSIFTTDVTNGAFAPMETSADVSQKNQESSHSLRATKERPKRTSEILRESSRYSDDIAKLNDLMLQDYNRKMHKTTPVNSLVSSKGSSLNNHETEKK
ncbi:uncharacterized protein LOC121427273 [Lytechinus variegatus]|uniref:uncharacterized protein LOC121427273 n=1 Tax=Lytechinus variegatus TaxID=7654 RepID=UPI001BB22EBE|nr:uncharacterized protein LOC121427273 [Lytechinus variegatus]